MTKLNDINLNSVTGGGIFTTISESRMLKRKGYLAESFDIFDMTFRWCKCTKAIEAAWARVGVICVTNLNSNNQSYYNGEEIDVTQAMQLL